MRGWQIAIALASIPLGLYLGARFLLPPVGRVEVVGNSRLTLEEVQGKVAPYLRGRNLLTVPTKEIVKALGEHPLVEGCEVWKKFPDSLLIVIRERPDLGGLETSGVPPEVYPQALALAEALRGLGVREVRYHRGFFTLVTHKGTKIRLRASEAQEGAVAIGRVLEALGERVPREMYFAGPNKVAVALGGAE